jgi:hypothetical protein
MAITPAARPALVPNKRSNPIVDQLLGMTVPPVGAFGSGVAGGVVEGRGETGGTGGVGSGGVGGAGGVGWLMFCQVQVVGQSVCGVLGLGRSFGGVVVGTMALKSWLSPRCSSGLMVMG